jgi:HEAT repeat protein
MTSGGTDAPTDSKPTSVDLFGPFPEWPCIRYYHEVCPVSGIIHDGGLVGLGEDSGMNTDLHEGHPEAGYRTEDIAKEMTKRGGDVDALIDLLKSRSRLDREKAADYLGEIGDPKAVPALIEALGDPAISWIAAESLGKLGDKRAVQPLIASLGSDEKWLRRNAAKALGLIGDPAAVEPLIKLLLDGKHDVRQAAAEALGTIGAIESVGALQLLSADQDEKVRQTALTSIGKIEGKKSETVEERNPSGPSDQSQ